MKQKEKEDNKGSYDLDFVSRIEKRKSIVVCVKLSKLDLRIIEARKGDTPLSTYLRESALRGEL